MEIRSNIGMDTILIKRAADMNCTWIRYSFEAAFTSTWIRDIVFETRCANYIFSDYDWYPCQLQCPTGLSSTMGLLWYISTIPCNFRSDARRYILSLFFFLVMKCVKIYPRVALQMQSNFYAHRTSFAKCIFTYTSMSYITKDSKFPHHNWKR